jgi:hypothetical protein
MLQDFRWNRTARLPPKSWFRWFFGLWASIADAPRGLPGDFVAGAADLKSRQV